MGRFGTNETVLDLTRSGILNLTRWGPQSWDGLALILASRDLSE